MFFLKYKPLEGQGYHLVGSHSAVKRCKWFRESLRGGGQCYKHQFYGISSHRCIQCTPALQFCTNACRFCWRTMGFDEDAEKFGRWDEPAFLAEKFIEEQMKFASGYGGNEKSEKRIWEEARKPKHVALSLAGEPLVYPEMSGLLEEFEKRKMTTFLVTNGTLPERIACLTTLPTQLYISMIAPDEKTYEKAARPKSKGNWKRYLESLELLAGLNKKTRTVLRMTLVKGLNANALSPGGFASDADGYAKQIAIAQPDYVEVKSFVFVGGARGEERGLKLDDMLAIEEVRELAKEIAGKCGYSLSDEHLPSRVVLLCKDKKAEGKRKLC